MILASDVFHSQGSVERLLFGSLLLIDGTDQVVAAAVGVAVLVTGAVLGRRWLASGFDRDSARALGARSPLPDLLLLALVAASAVAALDAIGALLSTALLVVPAATTRLLVDRLRTWQLATVALVDRRGDRRAVAVGADQRTARAPRSPSSAVSSSRSWRWVARAARACVAARGA